MIIIIFIGIICNKTSCTLLFCSYNSSAQQISAIPSLYFTVFAEGEKLEGYMGQACSFEFDKMSFQQAILIGPQVDYSHSSSQLIPQSNFIEFLLFNQTISNSLLFTSFLPKEEKSDNKFPFEREGESCIFLMMEIVQQRVQSQLVQIKHKS